jgi:hypothetical protein
MAHIGGLFVGIEILQQCGDQVRVVQSHRHRFKDVVELELSLQLAVLTSSEHVKRKKK